MNEQQLLPTIDPSENDLIERALNTPFDKKVDQQIGFLKLFSGKRVVAGVSGGKDSEAIKGLLKMSGIEFESEYNKTTIDPPELIYHLKEHHQDVKWNVSKHGHLILQRMVQKMSIPTRMGRWCCSEYKDCCSNDKSIGVVGVRIEESARRAGLWKQVTIHSKTGRTILAPIAYWTEQDVWRFIKENNIPYCSLYDEGFSRLGCVGCPLNNKAQAIEFKRWPKFEAMWKKGIDMVWERGQKVMTPSGRKYAAAKFESPDALWNWWITGQKEDTTNCVFEEMMENV